MGWAEGEAARRGRPAVLVTNQKGGYNGQWPFEPYRKGRHLSPTSRTGLGFRPGAVIAHAPLPETLELAQRVADRAALVVVEHPAPWLLAGWAAAVGAKNLLTGAVAYLLPALDEHLQQVLFYDNNGIPKGYYRDGMQRALDDLEADGLLDRDFVLSALGGLSMSCRSQKTVQSMIDKMVPPRSPMLSV